MELGRYVCRRCGKCDVCPEGIDIMEIFRLEGIYDRQMYNGIIDDPSMYALKERLRFWFGNSGLAKEGYMRLKKNAVTVQNAGNVKIFVHMI